MQQKRYLFMILSVLGRSKLLWFDWQSRKFSKWNSCKK